MGHFELFEEKVSILKKLIEKYPQKVVLYNKLGVALSKGGLAREATEVFENTLAKHPEDPTPVFYLISMYVETKELSKLKKLIETSKKKYSKDDVCLVNLKRIEEKVQMILNK